MICNFNKTLLAPLKLNVYACITFFYQQKRLPYLGRVLRSLCSWLCSNIEIVIIVNYEVSEESLKSLKSVINTYLSGRVTIKIHLSNQLEDNFYLTWVHKELMQSAYHSTSPQYDIFLYLEDDIELSWVNLLYWLEFLPILKKNQLIPGFVRVEQRLKDGMWMSADATARNYFDRMKSIKLGEYQFINLAKPYQGFWMLDRELMAEHINSPSFHKDDSLKTSKMGIRERAAMGLLYENIPEGFGSRYVVPMEKDRKHIEWFATVHHLPNTYANRRTRRRFGKIPFRKLVSSVKTR